ncbi:MAG: pyridoxal-phosphate dependent enzyme [Propionibacteriales bacterium]|nr:pyridoxal-phosphate dependent enzyme [Propionibacteriales bacterium]
MKGTLPDRIDVKTAAARIEGGVRRTPTLVLDRADTGIDARVVLKLELTQHSGSFKARGALNSVLSLQPGVDGVCAASGGNHAGAVSWAAQRAGLTADVFVPANATPAKIARIAEYGGRAHLVGGFVKDALEACQEFARHHDVPLLHPYDTFETVCGAGTTGLEIADQVPDVGLVLVGCGGGGLYAGLAAALEPHVRVQPVEPVACPDLANAISAGRPVDTTVGGVAVDSLGAPRIGEIAYATAVDHAVAPVLVEEEAILDARSFLWSRARVLAEPGACVALASLLTGVVAVAAEQTVVVVVSGGNNDSVPATPIRALSRGEGSGLPR